MPRMNEISSVKPQDPDLAKAYKPKRFKYLNPSFLAVACALVLVGLLVQLSQPPLPIRSIALVVRLWA